MDRNVGGKLGEGSTIGFMRRVCFKKKGFCSVEEKKKE